MILSRIASALKAQQWTTVLIEFILVVTGVLVALQLNNWNEARLAGVQESAFMNRLGLDVDTARDELDDFIELRVERMHVLHSISDMYFGTEGQRPLTQLECNYLSNAHIISYPPGGDVPSLSEAFDGGRIDLLRDEELVRALIAVKKEQRRLETALEAMTRSLPPALTRSHQDIVRWVLEPREDDEGNSDGFMLTGQCDLSTAGSNRNFLNELASLTSLNQVYVFFLRAYAADIEALSEALGGGGVEEMEKSE